jgi:sugar phosphate isomerase/epimerase
MTPLRPADLIASYWTLAGGGFGGQASSRSIARRAEAAAAAGFAGIGLRHDDFIAARGAGVSMTDVRRVIESAGVTLVELEFVSGWSSDDEAVRKAARAVEDELYAAADAVGGSQLNIGCSEAYGAGVALEAVVERFVALCDRAASHGLTVALEFMPWTAIADAEDAWEIVRASGRPNTGVLVDAWHYFRGSPNPNHLLEIPPERIVGVQFNDADATVVGTLREDTLHRRLLPGEGVFDLEGFVRLLDGIGVRVPYGIEVISDAQAALPLADAARQAFETSHAVISRARSR